MQRNELVEAMARAMAIAYDTKRPQGVVSDTTAYPADFSAAQAALAAIEAQGLAVVPVEPTEAMVRAGRDAENDAQNSPFWLPPEQIALMVYAAMLAASPLRGEG
jgi:hypothetical protein